MARRAKFNRQGEQIMGIAAMRSKIFNVPELAERTGIPYRTLYKRLSEDFGKTTAYELNAIVRVTGMTGEDLAGIFK